MEAWILDLGRRILRLGAAALVVVAVLQWAGLVDPHEPTACEVAAAEWPEFVRGCAPAEGRTPSARRLAQAE